MVGEHQTSIAIARGAFAQDDDTPPHPSLTIRHVDVANLESLTSLTDCSAVVVGLQPLGLAELAALPPQVTVIGRAGIGLDSIDLAAAERLGLAVVHQPSYATEEVADHATALVYALTRHVVLADEVARAGWPGWDRLTNVPSLRESTLGLVGLGRIGSAVARRLAPAFGRVVAFDPATSTTQSDIELVDSLDAVLGVSDVVSLHAPLTPETASMIDARALATMRPGSWLVNVSRGGLVDEEALANALVEGHLGGAALDVLGSEPPSQDNPLLNTPRTILSPHMAWLSRSSQIRLRQWTLLDVAAAARGGSPAHGRVAVAGATERRTRMKATG